MSYEMINSTERRQKCAELLKANVSAAAKMSAFIGMDGFIDEIVHVVDKRVNPTEFVCLPTIEKFGARVSAAAGKSTNFEMVPQLVKLGGNGPIMANAIAQFGIKLSYLGALNYPDIHPVFKEFSEKGDVHSIANAGRTDALEFDDGKLIIGRMTQLGEVNWENIVARYGKEKFIEKFTNSDLVGFVNWTMLPFMSEIWEVVLKDICPTLGGKRRKLFFDLADPEKRSKADIQRALALISNFEKYFDVILGLNEKEGYEIGEVLSLDTSDHSPEGLAKMALKIQSELKINTLVIHPVAFALAVSDGKVDLVQGPFCEKPLISTGAGDHFNSGFCLGKMLGLDNVNSLMTAVSTSGFYVRTAKSPTVSDLAQFLADWR
ncbi:MAG: carbohydrate kinase family protein [Verrucomicrobia bacterium]|nr:carbohydrate kinase family protein [Verrucomicrobiota bacterium]